MDYYPSDTIADRPTTKPLMQPNTYAPMVLSEGQGNRYQWVSQKIVFGSIGIALMLAVGVMVSRSTAIVNDAPIKIAPLAQPTVKAEEINKEILEGSIEDLNKLIYLSNDRIDRDKLSLKSERAKEITVWANKLVTDKTSDCYMSVYQRKCPVSVFLLEQIERYKTAYRLRKWDEASKALFQIESARIAWNGAVDMPFDGDATVAAIRNELERKKDVERQSDNAKAADLNSGGKR
jgi:hypothetical protein